MKAWCFTAGSSLGSCACSPVSLSADTRDTYPFFRRHARPRLLGQQYDNTTRQYAGWNAGEILLRGHGNHTEIYVLHAVRTVNQVNPNHVRMLQVITSLAWETVIAAFGAVSPVRPSVFKHPGRAFCASFLRSVMLHAQMGRSFHRLSRLLAAMRRFQGEEFIDGRVCFRRLHHPGRRGSLRMCVGVMYRMMLPSANGEIQHSVKRSF